MEFSTGVSDAYNVLDRRFIALRQKMDTGQDYRVEEMDVDQALATLEEWGQNVSGLRHTLHLLLVRNAESRTALTTEVE